MSDFYCEEVLSGKTPVQVVIETTNVLAYHHTRPFYPVHIIVIPKQHIGSLLDITDAHGELMLELIDVLCRVARQVTDEHGAARVLTNLGLYQESKHLHWHVISGAAL